VQLDETLGFSALVISSSCFVYLSPDRHIAR
jgi:hypothetical protein